MYRVFLTTEFDGTDFVGFQSQTNGRAVQDEIEKALKQVYKTDIRITGCSRTDAGVHARGHVSHADVPFFIPEDKIPLALNPWLDDDLKIRSARYVPENMSARFDNKGKRYIYRIYTGPVQSPLLRRYAYYCAHPLDIGKMQEAAVHFRGKHNFKAFCASGSTQTTFERRLYSVTVKQDLSGIIEVEVKGEAFLYNMVRIIAGTLLYAGLGKIAPDEIPGIISGMDRKRAGMTLPPQGLTLEEVYFENPDGTDLY